MSRRRWSEAQAWRYLAQRWARAKKTRERIAQAFVLGAPSTGLCSSVHELQSSGRITRSQEREMDAKFARIPRPFGLGGYCWPRTLAGARKRAKFCAQQAAALRPKRRVRR